MGNKKMRKCISHFTQQTADILLLQSSNVMRMSMFIQHLLQFGLKGYIYIYIYIYIYMYARAMKHGQQAIIQFWQLVSQVNCSYNVPTFYEESDQRLV